MRVATSDELDCAIRRHGLHGARRTLRRYGLIPPIEGAAGWVDTQIKSLDTPSVAGTTGASLSFTSSVTAGQLIVCCSEFVVGGTLTPTFSDTSSNVTSWTNVTTHDTTPTGVQQAIGWGMATASGACTPKVTWSSGTGEELLWIGAFDTPGGTITQDGTTQHTDSATNTNVATIVLPAGGGSGSNDLLVNMVSLGANYTSVAGGWTYFGTPIGEGCAYLLNAAGNSTPDLTQSASSSWSSVVVALQASGGGVTAIPDLTMAPMAAS